MGIVAWEWTSLDISTWQEEKSVTRLSKEFLHTYGGVDEKPLPNNLHPDPYPRPLGGVPEQADTYKNASLIWEDPGRPKRRKDCASKPFPLKDRWSLYSLAKGSTALRGTSVVGLSFMQDGRMDLSDHGYCGTLSRIECAGGECRFTCTDFARSDSAVVYALGMASFGPVAFNLSDRNNLVPFYARLADCEHPGDWISGLSPADSSLLSGVYRPYTHPCPMTQGGRKTPIETFLRVLIR